MSDTHSAGPPQDRCTRYQPGIMCSERFDAMHTGNMFYHHVALGWVFPAHDRKTSLPIFTWTFCPFCGGALPTVEDAVMRALSDPTTWDEDDGE